MPWFLGKEVAERAKKAKRTCLAGKELAVNTESTPAQRKDPPQVENPYRTCSASQERHVISILFTCR